MHICNLLYVGLRKVCKVSEKASAGAVLICGEDAAASNWRSEAKADHISRDERLWSLVVSKHPVITRTINESRKKLLFLFYLCHDEQFFTL